MRKFQSSSWPGAISDAEPRSSSRAGRRVVNLGALRSWAGYRSSSQARPGRVPGWGAVVEPGALSRGRPGARSSSWPGSAPGAGRPTSTPRRGFQEATDGDVVYFEHPTCSLYLEQPAEVARYRLSFDHLRAASLSVEESRKMLTRAADELA